MMRLLLYIGFIMICSGTFGQDDWRDSLSVARNAYKSGDYHKAMKYYESAQKKAPDDVDLSDEIGQSAYKAREFEKAEKVYQQSGGSKQTSGEKADNFHNLGNSRMKKKDYAGAVEAYKESLRNNPDDEKTRYNLSEAIRKLKDQQQKQNQQQQNQQSQQNQQNQQQGQQGQQNQQQNQQGQQGQQGQQNQQQGQQGEQNNSSQEGGNQGQLSNKTVDKMLDDLMKKEADTKRRMSGHGSGNESPKSGKDW